jgi:hypothetical protein
VIEAATGDLVLAEARLGRGLTREAFLDIAFAEDTALLIDNPPWRSYRIVASDGEGQAFAVIVQFEGSRLTGFTMGAIDDAFGRTWDDWSEEGEQRRRAWHDAWLRRTSGMARDNEFTWGTVTSADDSRVGGAIVRVRYRADEDLPGDGGGR